MTDDDDFKPTSPFKLNNSGSSVAPKEDPSKGFEERATKAFTKQEEFKRRAYEIGKEFIKTVEDKTLPLNKGELGKSLERETLQKVVQFGIDGNLDENLDDGMGSMGVITLLLKSILSQRDRINQLEYNLLQLEKSRVPGDNK